MNHAIQQRGSFPFKAALGSNWRNLIKNRIFLGRDAKNEKLHIAYAEVGNQMVRSLNVSNLFLLALRKIQTQFQNNDSTKKQLNLTLFVTLINYKILPAEFVRCVGIVVLLNSRIKQQTMHKF